MLIRLRYALLSLAGVVLVGTFGYMLLERWTLLEAAYMTVITVGTVGFREVRPLSPLGQIFTMTLIAAGVGVLFFSLGTVVDFMFEGHFTGLLEGRRMDRRIAGVSAHHIIAGLGRVGSVVAEEYAARGVPFVVIDVEDEALLHARESGWAYLRGDAAEEETLVGAGIRRARSLVAALDTDADNLFVTLTAREMMPDLFIVARATTKGSETKLRRAGADRVLTPTDIGGRRMAAMVLQPGVSDYLDIVMRSHEFELRMEQIELVDGDPYVGSTIGDAHIRGNTGAYILSIQSASGEVNPNPSPDTVMRAGDRLIVLGTHGQIRGLASQACTDPDVCYPDNRRD